MSYETFLQSVFGNQYSLHVPYIYSIHLYAVLIVVIVIAASAYTISHYRTECDRSFVERVRNLRIRYAAGRSDHDETHSQ